MKLSKPSDMWAAQCSCLASWQASVLCQMMDLPHAVPCFQQWPDVGTWEDSKQDRHAFPEHAPSVQTFSEFSWIKCSFYAIITPRTSLLHDPTRSPFEYLLQLLTFMTHSSCLIIFSSLPLAVCHNFLPKSSTSVPTTTSCHLCHFVDCVVMQFLVN